MSVIDPDSPRDWGIDNCGVYRQLGDLDSDGVPVGYIDERGTCWEDRREHDISLTCGRYHTAFQRFNRAGGVLGRPPCARAIAEQICLPQHVDEAVREAYAQFDPDDLLCQVTMAYARRRAACN